MNKFDKIFAKYTQSDADRRILDCASEVLSRIDRDKRVVEVTVHFSEVILKDDLYRIEEKIREAYELNVVRILPKYRSELWDASYVPEIMYELNRVGAVSRGFFNEYDYSFDGNKLNIKVSFNNGGIELLYCAKTNEIISNIIFGEFGIRYEVTLSQEEGYVESVPMIDEQLAEMQKIARAQHNEMVMAASRQKDEPEAPPEEDKYNDF